MWCAAVCLLAGLLFCVSCRDVVKPGLEKSDLEHMDISALEGRVRRYPDDVEAFNQLCKKYTQSSDFRKLISIAENKYRYAKQSENHLLMCNAAAYLGQTYLMLSKPDSMYYYFDQIAQVSDACLSTGAMMMVYNTLGVHNLTYAMNYNEALYNFYRALDLSGNDVVKDDRAYLIMCNIVNAYYLRGDTLGFEIAKDVYDYGVDSNNDFVIYNGAYELACMYLLKGDCINALNYVNRSTETKCYNSTFNSSDALRGTILARMGCLDDAEIWYAKAIKDAGDNYSLAIEAYQGYGNILLQTGRYDKAITQFEKGIKMMEDKGLFFYGYRLYDGISAALVAVGRAGQALDYMKKYRTLTDSVFNVEKERAFNNLRLRYESERKDNDLKEKDIALLRQQKRLQILAFSVVFALTIIISVLVLYRKQAILYKTVVANYNAAVQRENLLLKRLSAGAKASEDKYREIFERLDAMMISREIYKDKNLTIDLVADMLDTNRLYISKAVNTYAASSFAAYVNSYRVKAAVRMMSDSECVIPIKAIADEVGYNNLPSFYTNFQKVTGVSPSKFRNEILHLDKDEVSL